MDYEKRLFLIKHVDCYALSDARKNAFREYVKQFSPVSNEEIKEISDLVYLQETTIREIIRSI